MAEGSTVIYKYLDKEGLGTVWNKIKENFPTKIELESVQDDINGDISNLYTKIDEISSSMGNSAAAAADNITIKSTNGKISTALGLSLNSNTKTIDLIATGEGVTDENRLISSISYSDFVKDGILSSVELVVIDESNESHEQGTYLLFTFNTDSGKDNIYVNVSDLMNVYEGSTYITIVDNKTIELNQTKLVTDLSGNFVSLAEFNSSTESLNSQIVSNSDAIAALQERLNGVEAKANSNETNIGTLQSGVDSLNEQVAGNNTQINSLWEQLDLKASQENLDTLTSRVDTNENDIKLLSEKITKLEGATGPDGELVTISISQVTDFEAMTAADIEEICTIDETGE